MEITDGKVHNSKKANSFSFPKGSVVVMGRGYLDFKWMSFWTGVRVTFVTWSKVNMKYSAVKNYQSGSMLESGILKDQLITLTGESAKRYERKKLRLVHVLDCTTDDEYEFLSNNLHWNLSMVATIYQQRWHIEIFSNTPNSVLRSPVLWEYRKMPFRNTYGLPLPEYFY